MNLNQRLTYIQDCIRDHNRKFNIRRKELNRLRIGIVGNKNLRIMRDRFGEGPYSFNQYLEVEYGDAVRTLSKQSNYLFNIMRKKKSAWNGGKLRIPKIGV